MECSSLFSSLGCLIAWQPVHKQSVGIHSSKINISSKFYAHTVNTNVLLQTRCLRLLGKRQRSNTESNWMNGGSISCLYNFLLLLPVAWKWYDFRCKNMHMLNVEKCTYACMLQVETLRPLLLTIIPHRHDDHHHYHHHHRQRLTAMVFISSCTKRVTIRLNP